MLVPGGQVGLACSVDRVCWMRSDTEPRSVPCTLACTSNVGLDVVVGDVGRAAAAARWWPGCPAAAASAMPGVTTGVFFSALSRVDLVLRRHHRDRVLHARLGVEPVVGRRLCRCRTARPAGCWRRRCWVRPIWSALVRSTFTRRSGVWVTWWMCTSTAPGTPAILRRSSSAISRFFSSFALGPGPARRSARAGRSSAPASRCRRRRSRTSARGTVSGSFLRSFFM